MAKSERQRLLDRVKLMAERGQRQTLLLRMMIEGRARWEPFSDDMARGEVCVGGMRYLTRLGENGVPEISDLILAALKRVESEVK